MSQPYGYNPYYGGLAGVANHSSWSPLGTSSIGVGVGGVPIAPNNNSSAAAAATKHYLIDEYAFDPTLSAWMSGSVAPPSLASITSSLRSPSPSIDLSSLAASSSATITPAVAAASTSGGVNSTVTPPTSTRRAVSAEEFTHVTGGSTKKWPRASSLTNAAALLSKGSGGGASGSGGASGNATAKSKKSGQIDIEEEISTQNLYKTELCRSFEETGACRYGTKCQFAHGREELRPVLRHPKYKTEVCKTFHTIGTCPYGKRCRFIHSLPGAPIPAGATEVDPDEESNDDDTDIDNDDDDQSGAIDDSSSKIHHSTTDVIEPSQRKQLTKPDPSVWSTQWPTSNPTTAISNNNNNNRNNSVTITSSPTAVGINQRRTRRPQSSSSSLSHETMSPNAATFQPQASAFVAAAAAAASASSGAVFDIPSLSYNNTPSSSPSPSSSVSSSSDISLSSVEQFQAYQAHNLADIFAKQLLFDVPTPPSPVHESASVDESDLSSVYRLSVFSHFL